MSSSIAVVAPRCMPYISAKMPYLRFPNSTARPIGETRSHSYMDGIRLRATQSGPNLPLNPLRGRRLVTHASRSFLTESVMVGPKIGLNSFQSIKPIKAATQMHSATTICASTYMAETQTVSRSSLTSIPGKENLPMLDHDGGSGFRGNDGFTPYYRGDDSGAGGGAGGGGYSSTGGGFPWFDFWFFIILFLLRFLVTQIIAEGHFNFKYSNGKNKPVQRYL